MDVIGHDDEFTQQNICKYIQYRLPCCDHRQPGFICFEKKFTVLCTCGNKIRARPGIIKMRQAWNSHRTILHHR
jgi:hypothetical protein